MIYSLSNFDYDQAKSAVISRLERDQQLAGFSDQTKNLLLEDHLAELDWYFEKLLEVEDLTDTNLRNAVISYISRLEREWHYYNDLSENRIGARPYRDKRLSDIKEILTNPAAKSIEYMEWYARGRIKEYLKNSSPQ